MSSVENVALHILLAVLCLAVLVAGCVAVEAIDTSGCRTDCKRAGLEFLRYEFGPHHCWGLTASGDEHQLY